MKQLPAVRTDVDAIILDGGLDLISPPGYAKPGTCRFASNYELEFGGGYRRAEGFERFDGRPSPSGSIYVVLYVDEGSTAVLGTTVTGGTSSAEGKIVWISDDLRYIGLTRLLEGFSFEADEDLIAGVTTVATILNPSPAIDAFVDNDVAYAAAEDYRADIEKPTGAYAIRGVAIIDDKVFCWRDDEAGEAMHIYKATTGGWEAVPLNFRVSFTGGGTEYIDGSTLTQGGITAEILRVVVTTGDWGGTAEGYFVIEEPTGGSFTAGAAVGTGTCTLSGAETPIELLANGRVQTVAHNFYGSSGTKRLYGCDGVNIEFEFDGTVYVPIETGMGNVRASHVAVHKQHLFFSFGSSVQHSGTAEPYKWTPIFGAGELATGEDVTNFVSVSGSETNAALMIECRNSVFVLYGSDSESWQLTKIADESGSQPYSAQLMGSPIVFDRDGFIQRRPTDTFGNFSYESASRQIEPLVKNGSVMCSVLAKDKSRYRCFFSDGLWVSGTPTSKGIAWMPCDYGRVINVAVGGEIAGRYRIFLGDTDGWVLEADVGRSFDGEVINAGLRLSSLTQRNMMMEKQYRYVEMQLEASTAFYLAVGAEYSDTSADQALLSELQMVDFKKQYGQGLFWDFNAWDRAYWDGTAVNLVRYDIHGKGRSVSLLFRSESDRELSHVLKTAMVTYTPRRLGR